MDHYDLGAPSSADVGQRRARIIVISQIRFYREGLERMFAESGGVDVLAALAPTPDAVERVPSERPDLVLVDVSCGEGLSALRALAARAPAVQTVAAAISSDGAEVVECAAAGVAGYVTASASFPELLSIVQSVARGEVRCLPLAAAVLRRRLSTVVDESLPCAADGPLTGREVDIARLLAQNLANKEIAHRLNIEISTVKTHVHHILQKLHVGRRHEAVARLRRRGVPNPPAFGGAAPEWAL